MRKKVVRIHDTRAFLEFYSSEWELPTPTKFVMASGRARSGAYRENLFTCTSANGPLVSSSKGSQSESERIFLNGSTGGGKALIVPG